MEIIVNGETRQVAPGTTVAQLIDLLEMGGRRVAVELNLEILPRSAHGSRRLQAGDRLEIVQAIGGG